jgi:hypothetical protein
VASFDSVEAKRCARIGARIRLAETFLNLVLILFLAGAV